MKNLLFIFSVSLLLAAGCTGEVEKAPGKPKVFVSIPPQAYFVERVGGGHVELEVLVEPGQSPHTYEPSLRQMSELAHARAFFSIGVPFEKSFIPKIKKTYPNITVIETHSGIWRQPTAQAHEHEGEHEHANSIDPHVWLDPKNAKIMASNICGALKRLDSAHAGEFDDNLAALHRKLDRLDEEIRAMLAPLKGRKIYVFHPAFGYFAKAYGLEQVAIEFEGKEPSARQLAALIEKAKKDIVKAIFVEPQFAKSSAEAIAREIGAGIETMDPLAKDYMKNLKDMAEKIMNALSNELEHQPRD